MLKRETNYLLTKAQRFVPKLKTTTSKVPLNDKINTDEEKSTTTTQSTEGKFNFLINYYYYYYFFVDNRPEL